MIRRLNRLLQDYLRPKRLAIGKMIWDKKTKKQNDLIKDNKIDMEKVKSIIVLRYDRKIGDMVITTSLFREIKKQYPNIKIGVVTGGAAVDIIKNNKNVDDIYIYDKKNDEKLVKEITKKEYDILLDFSEVLKVKQMKFINQCNAKINIGINKKEWNLFDISHEKNNQKHISEIYKKTLQILGIENPNMRGDIKIFDENRIKENFEEKICVLNPYAATKYRSLKREKILEVGKEILKHKNIKLVLIGEKTRQEELVSIAKELDKKRVLVPSIKGINGVCAWIEKADFVVSPDTSIVHIASALDKPQIAIYRQDLDNNSIVWGPNSDKAIQIYSKDVALKGKENDINMFEINELEKGIEKIIKIGI